MLPLLFLSAFVVDGILVAIVFTGNQDPFIWSRSSEIFDESSDCSNSHFSGKLLRRIIEFFLENRLLPSGRSVEGDNGDLILLARFYDCRMGTQCGWIIDRKNSRD